MQHLGGGRASEGPGGICGAKFRKQERIGGP